MIYPQPQLDLVQNLTKLPNVTTEINFGPSFEHLDFNVADPLLAHKEIRQAIAYAIDRNALVNATVGQFSDKAGVLGNRLIMANQTGYEDHSGDYAKQDIAKAKSLLEGIGCTMGGDGYYTCFGKPLEFKVETTQKNPLRDQTITIIANQVKEAGIKLTEDANPDIFAGADKPHSLVAEGFQIALFAWVGTPSLASNAPIYLSPEGGGKGQNYTQGGTPDIDTALNQMSTAADSDAEIAAANQADKLLWDQMYTLPLYQKPTLLAYDSNYKGIGDNASSSGPLWNSETFSLS
jgi:peptide/nickel transport system substrate-binding protein